MNSKSHTITQFVCQECGTFSLRWAGKCPDCGAWNSLVEETVTKDKASKSTINVKEKLHYVSLSEDSSDEPRFSSSISELDRVLGGGLVQGSAILIGGEPGIGKSTLLLQLAATLAMLGSNAIYISGEESAKQIKLRAKRLGYEKAPINLLSATNVNEIITTLNATQNPELVIVDSIQTMFVEEYSSSSGTVSQIKASAQELINLAKSKNFVLLLVGHVTKEGQIAGPKVLEHMVDVVLYFEGDRGHHFRIIRATKNRFGGVNEIGVFEMKDTGLSEISNPSELFLSNSGRNISGSSIFAGIEGSRPLLIEVQALTSPSHIPTPRRAVVGWDLNRLAMIIAVIGVRYGLYLGDKEVYLNIVGGIKINEPAADLAILCALISAATNNPLPPECIIFGEIGLAGEVRQVSHTDTRLKESIKLGFKNAIIPAGSSHSKYEGEIKIHEISHIKQLKEIFS